MAYGSHVKKLLNRHNSAVSNGWTDHYEIWHKEAFLSP